MPTISVYTTADDDDGRVESSNAVYATARSGSSLGASSTSSQLGQADLGIYIVYEWFLRFDTSALGASAVVSAVTLNLYGKTDASDTDFTINCRANSWGPAVTTADFVAGANLAAQTLYATFATSGMSTAAYNAFTSETAFAAGISLTSYTYMMFCSSRTEAGTTPPASEYVSFYPNEEVGSSKDPYLSITYAVVDFSPGFISPLVRRPIEIVGY